jgi:hypothetical protein
LIPTDFRRILVGATGLRHNSVVSSAHCLGTTIRERAVAYVREKKVPGKDGKSYGYYQLVEGKRVDGKVKQRVIAHLGKFDSKAEAEKAAEKMTFSHNTESIDFMMPCPKCESRGQLPAGRSIEDGRVLTMPCSKCGGIGQVSAARKRQAAERVVTNGDNFAVRKQRAAEEMGLDDKRKMTVPRADELLNGLYERRQAGEDVMPAVGAIQDRLSPYQRGELSYHNLLYEYMLACVGEYTRG